MIGLRIRNVNGIVQIDERYKNYELIAKGTATILPSGPTGITTDVPVPGANPLAIIAVRASNWCVVSRPNDATFSLSKGETSAGINITVEYFIYAPSSASDPGPTGLRVRNPANGELIYNSNKKYMRVAGQDTTGLIEGASYSRSFPGKKVAVMQCQRAKGYTQTVTQIPGSSASITIIRITSSCSRVSGDDSASVGHVMVAGAQSSGNQGAGSGSWPAANYIFLDVTGQ